MSNIVSLNVFCIILLLIMVITLPTIIIFAWNRIRLIAQYISGEKTMRVCG